jgi:hypothetical protein
MNSTAPAAAHSASLPEVLTKITRADLGLVLPRLDGQGLEPNDVEGQRKLAETTKRYAHVYNLGGLVRGFRPTKGKGDKDGIQFLGQFRVQLADHLGAKWFVSGRAHVPGMFEEMLYGQLVEALKDPDDTTVQFLIAVGIKPPKKDKPSAVGYEWTVTPLVDVAVAGDPVAVLFEKAAQRALAAPIAEPIKEAATGTVADPVARRKAG